MCIADFLAKSRNVASTQHNVALNNSFKKIRTNDG
jgi:hypothetical protein